MMLKKTAAAGMAVAASLVFTGCATTDQDRLANTVYRTDRTVQRLDRELNETVGHLNETVAELKVQIDDTDRHMRTLQGMSEENQVKMDRLDQQLAQLTEVVFEEFGRLPPGRTGEWRPTRESDIRVDDDDIRIQAPGQDAPGELAPLDVSPPEESPDEDPMMAFQRAQGSFREENFDQALDEFDAFLRRFPNSDLAERAQFWKAEALFKLEDYEAAIREYERLRENHPQSHLIPHGMYNQAAAHNRVGQRDQAVALLEELADRYPGTQAGDSARETLRVMPQG